MSAPDWNEFRDLPPLLTPEEVAGILRIKVRSVYQRKRLGKLVGVVTDGGRWLVRKKVLLDSLAPKEPVGSPRER